MNRRLAAPLALVLALAPPVVLAGPAATPAAAAPGSVGCHGSGTLLTANGLYYPPAGLPRSTTFTAAVTTPAPCALAGTLTNATCAGGTLVDGTFIALQPAIPAECSSGAGEQEFLFVV